MENNVIVNLLWTGGWDSTYRLLELLIVQKKEVSTHYLIDPCRPSAEVEKATMERIRKAICKRYPETKDLFLPTKCTNVEDVPQDEKVHKAYNNILENKFLGSQYDWLARYCRSNNLNNVELGTITRQFGVSKIFATTNFHGQEHLDFHARISTKITQGVETHFYDKDICSDDEYMILGYYTLPICKISKEGMGQRAKEHGFYDILKMSRFCHRPMIGKFPCGRCNPCADAIREGCSSRVGLPGLALSLATRVFKLREVKSFLLKWKN